MVRLTGDHLTIDEVVAVARRGVPVADLDAQVVDRMRASRAFIDDLLARDDGMLYGVNTGFGPLANRRIDPAQASRLSRNLILNCCAGVGPPLQPEVVRAMMVLRVNTLARGHSGVRPEVATSFIRMLNAGLTPVVPSQGSLGASGDLAPLAHIAAVVTRDPEEGDGGYSGHAWLDGERLSGAEAMRRAGIERLVPLGKEGLGLTNGTTFMVAAGALAVADARDLLEHAEIAAALSFEALQALSAALHPALHEANQQPGQNECAARLRALTGGSGWIDADPERVQDAYSVRCTPQVLGPIRDVIEFVHSRFASVLNGTSDNPLVFLGLAEPDPNRVISGGNFHGQGPAMWLDFLSIATAEIGSLSERRTFRLLTPGLNAGLPSMLVPEAGLDSGLMVAQYTAAALVSENKTLAHPDSVDSIPSSANQEDHVSMGANAARHTRRILDNVCLILAIELLTAAQAVDLRDDGPERLGRGTAAAFAQVRRRVDFLEHDRELTPDIEALAELIRAGDLAAAARAAIARPAPDSADQG